MKVAVTHTFNLNMEKVRAGTRARVRGGAVVTAARNELAYMMEEYLTSHLDNLHVSLEQIVREHLIEEGYLEAIDG